MTDPTVHPIVFRIVFAVLFVTLLAVVGTYRRKAQAGRHIDSSKETRPVFLILRLGGLVLWGYCLIYIAYPRILGWSFVAIPPLVRWIGAAIVLLLIPFVVASQKALGRNVSPTVMTHEDHELITTGPYRWIRNPLYTAGGFVFAGLGLVAASWLLVALAAIALIAVRVRLPVEEAELEARFGQAYRDYAARTGRFFPRMRRR